jgi:hypothetical protein
MFRNKKTKRIIANDQFVVSHGIVSKPYRSRMLLIAPLSAKRVFQKNTIEPDGTISGSMNAIASTFLWRKSRNADARRNETIIFSGTLAAINSAELRAPS